MILLRTKMCILLHISTSVIAVTLVTGLEAVPYAKIWLYRS